VTSEDFFCRACHKRFELRGAETDATRLAALPDSSVLNLRNPALAAILSVFGIGFGQFYNGDLAKGLAFNAIYLAGAGLQIAPGNSSTQYIFWVMAGIWGVSLLDAPLSAWRINRLVKGFSGPSLLFWTEFAILAGLAGWYIVFGTVSYWTGLVCPVVRFFL